LKKTSFFKRSPAARRRRQQTSVERTQVEPILLGNAANSIQKNRIPVRSFGIGKSSKKDLNYDVLNPNDSVNNLSNSKSAHTIINWEENIDLSTYSVKRDRGVNFVRVTNKYNNETTSSTTNQRNWRISSTVPLKTDQVYAIKIRRKKPDINQQASSICRTNVVNVERLSVEKQEME
jgi:hypothetical protein